MGKTFTECGDSINAMVRKCINDVPTHADLKEAQVTVTTLFAASSTDSPAITANGGYPAAAEVRINPLKKRVEGLADATITIDQSWWSDVTAEERLAMIDHELCHLVVKRKKKKKKEGGDPTMEKISPTGAIVVDDAGRPVLKIRKHDWQTGGFYEVVERHQMNATEAQGIEQVHKKFTQGVLAFG